MLVGRVAPDLRGPKRRHFDGIVADMDMHEAKPPADDERPPEQRLDLLGRRVGGDVEVLGLDAEQQIADGAADDERLEAFVLQPARDRASSRGQLVAPHRMLVRRINAGSVRPPAGQQAGKQATNHGRRGVARGRRGSTGGGRRGRVGADSSIGRS